MPSNIFDLQDIWGDSGTVFNGIKINVSNTTAAAGSRLLRLDANGNPQFAVDPSQGVIVGAATGGGKGPGTINAAGYYLNGTLFTGSGSGVTDGDKGDITVSATGTDWRVNAKAVTYAKFQDVAAFRFLGRFTGTTGVAQEGTGTQATAQLDLFTDTLKGLVPPSGGGTTNFLRADGTFAVPPTGGGGAPVSSPFVAYTADATLTNERVLTDSGTINWDLSTPGQVKANTSAGGGNVSNSGTPTVGQYAKWVTATTIQGVAAGTVRTDIGAQPLDATLTAFAGTSGGADDVPYFTGVDTFGMQSSTSYGRALLARADAVATRTYIQAQAADADLTALAGLTGTNTIYYRSAADTWSPVTFSGLTFTGGVLTATAGGGGNVSNSGTPALNDLAQWTDATHVQGLSIATFRTTPVWTGNCTFSGGASGNNLRINGAAAGSPVAITALGNDADIHINHSTKGVGAHRFYSNNAATLQVTINNYTAANSYLQLSGGTAKSSISTGGVIGPVEITDPDLKGDARTVTPVSLGDNSTRIANTGWIRGQNFISVQGAVNLTGGFTFTPNAMGTIPSGTVTPTPFVGNYQYYSNAGAHTLAAPSSDCAMDILVTNASGAGAITFSGFTVGSNVGDALTTTVGHKFIVSIRRINATATYTIKALQ